MNGKVYKVEIQRDDDGLHAVFYRIVNGKAKIRVYVNALKYYDTTSRITSLMESKGIVPHIFGNTWCLLIVYNIQREE